MKKTVRMAGLLLLCISLFGVVVSAVEPPPPAWERYAPAGGQIDDTGYADVLAWLLVPGNRDTAMPNAAGQEVLASTIVENARSLVGKYPYVYGGESPEEGGFDCTGLVWYVYNQMSGLDITLSQAGRSKAALAAAGEQIYDTDAFLPGDVIQFTYAHVAIYVGDGRVVHARTTGTMIQETDLNYSNVEYAVRYPGVVQSDVLASGEWKGFSWVLRRNGELTVSGSGAMSDPSSETDASWYSYRESITSAVLDKAVTSIGDYAFFGCKNMKSISAPGVTAIGLASFYNCAVLTEPVFSDRLTSVGRMGFYGCAAMTEIALSEGMTAIDYGAFCGCSSLTEITIPDTVTSIGDIAFEKCVNLERITLPDGVMAIGESAFFNCKSLEEIVLGSSVETINDCAFYGCASLAAVSIPKTVTRIGDWAFSDCSALAEVVYSGTVTEWSMLEIGDENAPLLNARLICTGRPDTPVVTLVVDTDDTPVLLWETVANAEKYEIWRAGEDGIFSPLAETDETVFYDLSAVPGSMYFYMVRAVSGATAGKFSDILVFFQMKRAVGVPPCS